MRNWGRETWVEYAENAILSALYLKWQMKKEKKIDRLPAVENSVDVLMAKRIGSSINSFQLRPKLDGSDWAETILFFEKEKDSSLPKNLLLAPNSTELRDNTHWARKI